MPHKSREQSNEWNRGNQKDLSTYIAGELKKTASSVAILRLSKFFNWVIVDHEESTAVLVWKKKGSPKKCSSYSLIRLLSHNVNIFEHILYNRIREIVQIIVKQARFVKNYWCETFWVVIHKTNKKHCPLYIAFVNLKKTFQRATQAHLACSAAKSSAGKTFALGWTALPRSER